MLSVIARTIGNIPNETKKRSDRNLIFTTVMICIFGLVMIWSASMYEAQIDGNEFYYVYKQLIFLIVGIVVMMVVSLMNYDFFRKFADFIMVISVFLLILTTFMGSEGGGAERWLNLGFVTIQPSELTKIAVLIFISKEAEKRKDDIDSLKNFLLLIAFIGIVCGLIYKQPALSATVIVAALIVIMYFIAGGNLLYIVSMVCMGVVAVYLFITGTPWRMVRILAYLDPWSDLMDSGWQPAQSLMALASGGIFGQGIGNGRAKLLFLPEAQNDYIFAIIGEELGLVGCIAVIAAYLYFILRIVNISLHAPDIFSRMFTSGFALLISMQVFLNIAVVTNLIPSTGVMLPFISSGGSSLVTLMFALGIVLNISRHQKYKTAEESVKRAG